ncbi:MAG: acyltransferase family protein, partial [Lacisediminihabitans sp.]
MILADSLRRVDDAGSNPTINVTDGATARNASRFAYNPALDGLRALAIMAVVAQHAGIPGVNGYHGVTLFFVISGYLITRLLLQEHAGSGRIGLRRFYGRRLARLGPALVVAVLATWAWLAATNQPFSTYWMGIVGSLTYTTDLMQAISGNAGVSNYYQWSWSLGVEELFYLIWPVSLLLLVKWRRFAWTVALLSAAVIACWVLRALLLANGVDHYRFYFAPDTNADALLLGTLLALVVIRYPNHRVLRIVGRCAGPIGLLALVALVWPHGADALAQIDDGALGQAALASAAVVLWMATSPTGWTAKVFGVRPVVLVGRLSYGIYLWNLLTIFVFVALVQQ